MSVALKVSHNLPAINAIFRKRAKQIPYATARALNATALQAQAVEQRWIMRAFTIRSRFWMSRQVKHKPRATKRQQWTKLAIDPPGGRQKSGVIGKFERGGRKTPRHRHIAIPSEAKRTATGKIKAAQQIKGFNFKRVGSQLKGARRTWIIERGAAAGIYQRFGAKRKRRGKRGQSRWKGRYRMLYAFASSVPIDKRLRFIPNIQRVVRRRFPAQFTRAWREAMRTAR